MKGFFSWLEADRKRLRMVLAVFTAVVWLLCTIASYVLWVFGHDTLALYSLVTAQFAAVVGFYMTTKANTD